MRIRTIIATAALAVAIIPAPGHAQAVVTLPAADITGYLPRDLLVTKGAQVQFINLDPIASPAGAPHDVRSELYRSTKDRPWCVNFPGTQRCPLLYTPLIGPGETAVVQGIADLKVGVAYDFYCTAHPSSMSGTITVIA